MCISVDLSMCLTFEDRVSRRYRLRVRRHKDWQPQVGVDMVPYSYLR